MPASRGRLLRMTAHSHISDDRSNKLRLAVALTCAFVAVELVAGLLAHSLALVADAGHNFADAAALAFSWYAVWIARRPSNPKMTYGYHRVGIMAALVNAVSLVLIALVIFWEALGRLRHPWPADGRLMIGVAIAAIAVNVLVSLWLRAGARDDINMRAAYLHMIGDAISAFGVVAAGVIILVFGWQLADPVVSLLIAVLILVSSWGVLKESLHVLLEGTPATLRTQDVEIAIKSVDGVLDAHDLHVWTVGPGALACSVHVLVDEQSIREGQQILRAVAQRLRQDFKIGHTTVQVEVDARECAEMYCTIEPSADHAGAHQHAGHHH